MHMHIMHIMHMHTCMHICIYAFNIMYALNLVRAFPLKGVLPDPELWIACAFYHLLVHYCGNDDDDDDDDVMCHMHLGRTVVPQRISVFSSPPT